MEYISLQEDIELAIRALTTDDESHFSGTIGNIGIFLRGSDQTDRKTFLHKYESYGKYPNITNGRIKRKVGEMVRKDLIIQKGSRFFLPASCSPKPEKVKVKKVKAPAPVKKKVAPILPAPIALEVSQDHCFIGQHCIYYRIRVLRKKSQKEWLQAMMTRYSLVTPYPLKESQITAWADCFDVMKNVAKALPESFDDVFAIFEYVMPIHRPGSSKSADDKGIRSDVILLSAETAVVLEFKQREDDYEGFIAQAEKYRHRLESYHSDSNKLKIKSVLVLTKTSKYLKQHKNTITCSADQLTQTIQLLFEPSPQQHPDVKGWLNAPFVFHKT